VDEEDETDGVMVENAGGEPMTIRIDRDPDLFSHVLKLFDTPLPAEDTEKLQEELDYYGLLPSCAMLPASTIAAWHSDHVERFTKAVVSNIVNQMAKLMKEQLHGLDGNRFSEALNQRRSSAPVAPELSFCLCLPTSLWTEAQVRCGWKHLTEADHPVRELPSDIQQALETRLHSLGYGVTISECTASMSRPPHRYCIDVTRIKLSWADK
jgi:hypothetical protein